MSSATSGMAREGEFEVVERSTSQEQDIEFYGGATRFELELEFAQSLSNPMYLQHLCLNHYSDSAEFINYCKYLQYFGQPEYIIYLSYPGPTLKALELIQQEQFRKDIIRPDVLDRLIAEWMAFVNDPESIT